MEPWKKNLYIIWIAQVFSLMGFGFAMPFIPFYFQELGVTDPDRLSMLVGLGSALPAVLMGIMALVWGALSDRIGRKIMMLRALLAGALIVGGLGFARSAGMVLALRAGQGLFTGTMTAAVTLVAAGTPKHRLSHALGLISSSNFVGFSFGPFVGGLTAEVLGYRTSFFIGGAILFGAFFLVLFGVRELRIEQDSEENLSSAEPKTEGIPFTLSMVLRQPLLLGLILMFLMRFSRSFTQPFLPLYIQEMTGRLQGASAITGLVTGMVGLATAAAALTLGRMGDKYDKIGLIRKYLVCAIFVAIPLFLVRDLITFSIFLVLTRFFLGGVEPMLHSLIGEHTPPQRRGIVFGVQTFVGSMGWFASPLVGSSVSVHFGLRYIFLFHAAGLAISLVVAVFFSGRKVHVRVPVLHSRRK